ncbi:hypothetical protein KM043_004613 [Ampulex compressa]|nr:hypothetical protein KM043_004613 [Ampulex compressa]
MRAVSFVKRLQWELPGTVCRHGLTIGDVDNDGDNELVVGTAEGELYIFKGSELWQKITGLGLVTSVAIGDIFNYGRNALVVICGDGWAHIFYSPRPVNPSNINASTIQQLGKESNDYDNFKVSAGYTTSDAGTGINTANSSNSDQVDNIADVDRDGTNEMILGLTDRVVRSYRWSSNVDLGMGKLVGLNKWECANQIGTVTLQHAKDGTPTLLVAQPGGTFMRIKCNPEDCRLEDDSCEANSEAAASCVDYQTLGISRMRSQNISTEIIGDLESGLAPLVSTVENKLSNYEQKNASHERGDDLDTVYTNSSSLEFDGNRTKSEEERRNSLDIPDDFDKYAMQDKEMETLRINAESLGTDQVDGNILGGNVILGGIDKNIEKTSLLPSYKDFSHKYHNNNNNDNEVQKNDISNVIGTMAKMEIGQGKPYALATLDGTIMLVRDENILWAMQVDHQIFALCRLDVTSDGADEIVACAWDGQTYILDQQQNSVRFQFEEPVRAFCTGYYSVSPGASTPCLVYNTFNNKIFLYYDVTLPSMVIRPLNTLEGLDPEERKIIDDLLREGTDAEKQQKMQQLNEWLLYGAH